MTSKYITTPLILIVLANMFKSTTFCLSKHCSVDYFCFMGKKRKPLHKILVPIVLNKYFIAVLAVAVWVTFFDKDDLFSQYELSKKLNQLRAEEKYYQTEIEKNKHDLNELRTNPSNLEKFAREKYLMKKDNEEIFVIVKDTIDKNSAKKS